MNYLTEEYREKHFEVKAKPAYRPSIDVSYGILEWAANEAGFTMLGFMRPGNRVRAVRGLKQLGKLRKKP